MWLKCSYQTLVLLFTSDQGSEPEKETFGGTFFFDLFFLSPRIIFLRSRIEKIKIVEFVCSYKRLEINVLEHFSRANHSI